MYKRTYRGEMLDVTPDIVRNVNAATLFASPDPSGSVIDPGGTFGKNFSPSFAPIPRDMRLPLIDGEWYAVPDTSMIRKTSLLHFYFSYTWTLKDGTTMELPPEMVRSDDRSIWDWGWEYECENVRVQCNNTTRSALASYLGASATPSPRPPATSPLPEIAKVSGDAAGRAVMVTWPLLLLAGIAGYFYLKRA